MWNLQSDYDDEAQEIKNYSDGFQVDFERLEDFFVPALDSKFEFYKLKSDRPHFMMGYWKKDKLETKTGVELKDVFRVVSEMKMSHLKSLESKLPYKNICNVDGVKVLKEYRRNGISSLLYKFVLEKYGYTILGDSTQYFGARKLWARLSKETDVKVDLVDLILFKVIEHDVILHHGKYEDDFDKRLWSRTSEKEHIRSILTKII